MNISGEQFLPQELEFQAKLEKERNVAHFLSSTAFSSIGNAHYGGDLTHEIFRNRFYVTSSDLENLKVSICADIVDDMSRNMVFITGFRGCGKTTFLYDLIPAIKNHIEKRFSQSSFMFQSEIINFEYGITGRNNIPEITEKLSKSLSSAIEKVFHRECGASTCEVLSRYLDVYKQNVGYFNRTIELNNNVRHFFEAVEYLITKARGGTDNDIFDYHVGDKLGIAVNELGICQSLVLLFIFYAVDSKVYLISKDKSNINDIMNFHTVVAVDNLDNMHNIGNVVDFFKQLNRFYDNGAKLIDDISTNNCIFNGVNLYENFTLILFARDTTVARFTSHWRPNRAGGILHKDISESVVKSEIGKKKKQYLSDFGNRELEKRVDNILTALNDDYLKDHIFSIFNSDYTRTVAFLASFEKDTDNWNEYHKMQNFAKDFKKTNEAIFNPIQFGSRGIVFRHFFNNIKDRGSINKIDAHPRTGKNKGLSRRVLSYLFNDMPVHNDRFLEGNDFMNLSRLYSDFHLYHNFDKMSSVLAELYTLYNNDSWSHLINIDSDYDVNATNIDKRFKRYEESGEYYDGDGKLRITCAGRIFTEILATHFEFFAAQYASKNKALFHKDNLNKQSTLFKFDNIIKAVLEHVNECCVDTYEIDLDVAKKLFSDDMNKFRQSDFVFRNKKGISMVHSERVINHHIDYLSAYRLYILSLSPSHIDIKTACITVVDKIKEYMVLQKRYIDNGYFSNTSAHLYQCFEACIEVIDENPLLDISIDQDEGERQKKLKLPQ